QNQILIVVLFARNESFLAVFGGHRGCSIEACANCSQGSLQLGISPFAILFSSASQLGCCGLLSIHHARGLFKWAGFSATPFAFCFHVTAVGGWRSQPG